MTGYALIIPELLIVVAAAWALFAERLPGGDRGSARVAGALAFAAAGIAAISPVGGTLFGGALVFDGPARFTRAGVALIAAIWFLWTASGASGRIREAVALAAFSATGGMLMASAAEMVLLVLAIELATMPAYVLIGYRRARLEGLEGALKYFLLSMLTSLLMLYGMSFLYGVSGSSRFDQIDLSAAGSLGVFAVLLTFAGLFAKLSAAPFHYWAPDAYSGAEPWTVAFVSTVPKAAGALALVRLVEAVAPTAPLASTMLLVVAVASMVLGNLAALTQTDVRRMMAYSGVAHTGYLLLGVAALSPAGYASAVLYSIAYALPSLGVMLVVAETGPALRDIAGLAQRRAAMAWMLVVLLVSLVGIPPLVGFFGKLYVFSAAVDAGLVTWVLVALVTSVISAGYYLRIVRAAFFGEAAGAAAVASPLTGHGTWAALAITVALTVAGGLGAGLMMEWLGALAS